jgi:hypothetical protein
MRKIRLFKDDGSILGSIRVGNKPVDGYIISIHTDLGVIEIPFTNMILWSEVRANGHRVVTLSQDSSGESYFTCEALNETHVEVFKKFKHDGYRDYSVHYNGKYLDTITECAYDRVINTIKGNLTVYTNLGE